MLSQPFAVIIFDIDGVLTEHAGTVSDHTIKKIALILNKKIYVGLVSGRPRLVSQHYRSKGGRDIDEIFNQIRHSKYLKDNNNLAYLLGFEQNGANVFDGFTDGDSRKNRFNSRYSKMSKQLQKKLWDHISKTTQSIFTHAEYKSHSIALWVHDSFASPKHLSLLKRKVGQCLEHYGLDSQFKTYQTLNTIDIVANDVSKAAAVDFFIRAGFPLSKIARIGDSTYRGGNDVPMVIYNGIGDYGGFSVRHYPELDCFPVISLSPIINKSGVEATLRLMGNMRFSENQPYVFG